ncbi:MAG: rhomboid family intramembrane serine protease [Pseudooceanicola nanhaiensis]
MKPEPVPGEVTTRPSTGHAVWIGILLLLCAIEGTLLLADLGLLGSLRWRSLAYQHGAFWSGLLRGWAPNFSLQPFTMFASYSFLHADWQHLAGNVLTLSWLGQGLGGRCGKRKFAELYALSALGGAVGFGLMSASPSPMVGASGAIMGLIGVWIVWDARDMARNGWRTRRIVIAVAARCGLLFLLNLLMFVVLHGLLAWQTHLGGFLAGAAAAMVLPPDRD